MNYIFIIKTNKFPFTIIINLIVYKFNVLKKNVIKCNELYLINILTLKLSFNA
jgi:hypothetical protein